MRDDKLTDIHAKYNLNFLTQLEKYFRKELNLTPYIGAEIEFYIYGNIDLILLEQKIGYKIKQEKGKGQYEIDILPSKNLTAYAQNINQLRYNIIQQAAKLGTKADFTSKPFIDDYGSALHIHLNFPEDNEIEKYAKILCHYLPYTIKAFLPKKEDLLRLDSKFMAPTHISYGGNNRTVLIRIPDSTPKRLEHRLAAANVDAVSLICNILQSIKNGLEDPKQIKNIPKIFGNAFDPQYDLTKIVFFNTFT